MVEAIRRNVGRLPRPRVTVCALLCTVLALVFATAGFAKIARFDELESTLVASGLVPVSLARFAAVWVIVLELAVALCLCARRTRTTALHTAALLVCLFIGYSAWRWWRDIPIPCHCFGMLFTMAPWQAVLLDLFLLGLITWLLARVGSDPSDRADTRVATGVPAENQETRAASSAPVDGRPGYVRREELFP